MTATKSTPSATAKASRGTQQEALTKICSPTVRTRAGIVLFRLTSGPSKRSCKKVSRRRTTTRAALKRKTGGHCVMSTLEIPLPRRSTGPVLRRVPIANHTMSRNRCAADRKRTVYPGTVFSLLTSGASTNERNIIPPIHTTAARM